ncbi:HAMP domain-containing histidine kinase [bacterium]|nr:HAMP domain-containing histidine kinase [bacterium]
MAGTPSPALLVPLLLVLALLGLGIQTWRLRRRSRALREALLALTEQEPVAMLGRIAAGVAHDLKTPLAALACSQQTRQRALARLEESLDNPHPAADVPDRAACLAALKATDPQIAEALQRMTRMAETMRLNAAGKTAAPEPVDVNQLIGQTLLLLDHLLKPRITVRFSAGEVPPVHGRPGPLGQVFLNLLLNAVQALEGGGSIDIATRVLGDEVEIRVLDDGPGLPADCADSLFKPGFTTKDARGGSGLGLAITRMVVEDHGGAVTAGNRPTGGAEFVVLLPVRGSGPAGEHGPGGD